MAYSLAIHLSFFMFSVLASSSLPQTSFPPTSVASSQLKFWSENVDSDVPKSLLSKLSPLSIQDMKHFATLASKNSLKVDPKFCSLANVVWFTNKLLASKVKNGYNEYGVAGISPKLDQIDANSFFKISNLKKGNLVHLPDLHDHFPSRSFLPYEISSKIPTSNIKDMKMMFPESFTSSNSKDAIISTFSYCNAPKLKGEIKSCPKSLKEMIGFAKNVLGKKHVVALASKSAKGSGRELEIGEIKQFPSQKTVSCHEVYFPFVTYFCHLLTSTQLYTVDLIEVDTKAPVNSILAICHMDTSQWPASHAAFHILKSSPGKTEACHWFTQIDLVWLAKG